jgi:hypothetical protein
MAVSPYDNLGGCTQGTDAQANTDAAKYKIENYRYVDPTNVQALKTYLSMGRPVQISCKLGHNFFEIHNADVFYTDIYPSTAEEQSKLRHGYHSMCLVGFDDNKGTNGAFRIVNSWSTGWGDKGFAWIDYKFFTETFCFSAYVIEGDKGGLAENLVNNDIVDPNFQVDGKDLITVRFKDDALSGRNRELTYNVFNKGKETIKASEDWNIIYYYYNAYNPEKDFGIIIYDYYTDDVGAQYAGQNGDFNSISNTMRKYGVSNWWNYVDVKPGYSVAKAVAGSTGYDYDFVYDYEMPNITGDYYLVLMADGFNAISEQYEQNNFIFFTGDNKKPLLFKNGIIQGLTTKTTKDNAVNFASLKKGQPNAYQIDEIAKLIKYQQRTGKLQLKAQELKSKSNAQSSKRLIKAILPREM